MLLSPERDSQQKRSWWWRRRRRRWYRMWCPTSSLQARNVKVRQLPASPPRPRHLPPARAKRPAVGRRIFHGGVTVAGGDGGVCVSAQCGGRLAGVWRQLLASVSGAVVCILQKSFWGEDLNMKTCCATATWRKSTTGDGKGNLLKSIRFSAFIHHCESWSQCECSN